ncbi:hypothetical protein Tco_0396842, partial [Tanacetum coccineum]
KIDSQASDLNAYKLVFKEVVGKLIKKVKELEDKLKARKKKFVVTEFNIEENEEQDVDPLIQLAKAAATAGDSVVPAGDSKKDAIPTSSSIPSDAFARGSPTPPGDTTGSTAAPSEKGKSPLLEEEHPVRKRSFKKRRERRTGWRRGCKENFLEKVIGCVGIRDSLMNMKRTRSVTFDGAVASIGQVENKNLLSETDVPTGPSFGFSADPFNKGKSPMVEEDPPIKQRSFRQREEDRLGEEAARKLYEEEMAVLE